MKHVVLSNGTIVFTDDNDDTVVIPPEHINYDLILKNIDTLNEKDISSLSYIDSDTIYLIYKTESDKLYIEKICNEGIVPHKINGVTQDTKPTKLKRLGAVANAENIPKLLPEYFI